MKYFLFNLYKIFLKKDTNQYLDRELYIGEPEVEEETSTGTTLEDTTGTGTIEIISTEIMTEEEVLAEETGSGEVVEIEEEEIELSGRLTYDKNGNLVGNFLNNKRQYIYSYDYKNRLVKIEKNIYKKKKQIRLEKIVEIKYDILGRRIEKKFNNGSYRKYYYSNQDIIIEENYSKKDKLKNSKEFTYGTAIDDVLSMDIVEHKTRKIKEEYVNSKGRTKTRTIKEKYIETSTYYYHKDHLGSIIAISDETGSIVEEYAYDVLGKPYTKQTDGTITRLKKSPIGNTRMYTGREYDRGLKLYYNRARYYNPQLGRFISRDPIDIADDVNLYAYVGNNSVMFVDRMGLSKSLLIIVNKFNSTTDIYKLLNDITLLPSDYDLSLNIKFGYDTVEGDKNNIKVNEELIKRTKNNNGYINRNGESISLSEFGNILYGFVGNKIGFSYKHLENQAYNVSYNLKYGKGTDEERKQNTLNNEREDRVLYKAGYELANKKKITAEDLYGLILEIKEARKLYIESPATGKY